MESGESKKVQKRLYEKPRLRTIELAAEEILATGCKTATQVDTGNMGCDTTPCFDLGT